MANIGTEQEIITVTPEKILEPYPTEFPVPEKSPAAPVEAPATVPA